MFILDNIDSINKKVIELISTTPLDIINEIPQGFNNNIAWNFGHLVTSSYSLSFRVTGADLNIQIPYFEKFKKGTKPEGWVSEDELSNLTTLAHKFSNDIRQAMAANKFENITSYTTQTFEVPITNIQDMLVTTAMHSTLHWQIIKDYKKILTHKL